MRGRPPFEQVNWSQRHLGEWETVKYNSLIPGSLMLYIRGARVNLGTDPPGISGPLRLEIEAIWQIILRGTAFQYGDYRRQPIACPC